MHIYIYNNVEYVDNTQNYTIQIQHIVKPAGHGIRVNGI